MKYLVIEKGLMGEKYYCVHVAKSAEECNIWIQHNTKGSGYRFNIEAFTIKNYMFHINNNG